MDCLKCGSDNKEGNAICSDCGAVLPSGKPPNTSSAKQPAEVKIVDFDMPFMSMVNFLVKLVLAAIPAAIIVAIIVVFLGGMIAAIFRH